MNKLANYKLLEVKASAAERDAERFAREPTGGPLAALRRRDAATLRAWAWTGSQPHASQS